MASISKTFALGKLQFFHPTEVMLKIIVHDLAPDRFQMDSLCMLFIGVNLLGAIIQSGTNPSIRLAWRGWSHVPISKLA